MLNLVHRPAARRAQAGPQVAARHGGHHRSSQHVPWYALLCLPVLFMNLAYGWAFFNPVRKVYYNLAITGLSVAICFFIGGVEALGLLPHEIKGLRQAGGFWGFVSRFNINTAGFVIVAMFLVTWLAAVLIWRYARIEDLIWRYARIEERWNATVAAAAPEPEPSPLT